MASPERELVDGRYQITRLVQTLYNRRQQGREYQTISALHTGGGWYQCDCGHIARGRRTMTYHLNDHDTTD